MLWDFDFASFNDLKRQFFDVNLLVSLLLVYTHTHTQRHTGTHRSSKTSQKITLKGLFLVKKKEKPEKIFKTFIGK